MKPGEVFHQAIAERAYMIFERRGGQPGHEVSDWLQAETEVLNGFLEVNGQIHVARQKEWVALSYKLGTLYPLNEPEQMGCVTTLQRLSRFEEVIDRMEVVYGFRMLRGLPERIGDLDDIFTYSYLWVLGAYEIIRTLAQQTNHPAVVSAKKSFARVRVPLAKLKAGKATDFNFPFTGVLPPVFGVGWAINKREIISRAYLSHEMVSALKQYADQA